MVFIGHFLLLLLSVVALYLLATYSSLRAEMAELKKMQERFQTLSDPKQIKYYQNWYSETCSAYERRKKSPFAKLLILFYKKLDQEFPPELDEKTVK